VADCFSRIANPNPYLYPFLLALAEAYTSEILPLKPRQPLPPLFLAQLWWPPY